MRIGVIFLGGSPKQHECFWPSYAACRPGIPHDLILVHRNRAHIERIPIEAHKHTDRLIIYNKIIDGQDVPHGAFGAYRHCFDKFRADYDMFAFISDDVILRRDDWLQQAQTLLFKHEKIGFVAPQIFNGSHGEYPHPSHLRAPIWFAKTEALCQIRWEMNSDHDGEMKIADQITAAGYFGVQIGHKIDFAYDSLQKDHITQLWERGGFPEKNLREKFTQCEIDALHNEIFSALWSPQFSAIGHLKIRSPFAHIGERDLLTQVQPIHGLVYDRSVSTAQRCMKVNRCGTIYWIDY